MTGKTRTMRNFSRTALALSAAAFAAGLLAVPSAEAAPSAVPSGQSDVNGDGYGDLVTGSEATVSGAEHAGAIVVNTGSSRGISSGRNQIVSQNSAGVPGASETNDRFGSALATGDLNDDGYTDVVAGTPREKVGGDVDGGTVAVLWGSTSGLAGGTTLSDPAPTAHDHFGNRLAVGDFDGDGRPELAVGTSDENVWIFDGISKAGAGSHRELSTAIAPGSPDYYRSLAVGDFDGDGSDDLVVGGRYDEDGSFDGAALVHPGAGGAYTVLPDEAPVATTGDFDGDGHDDLLLGSPDENAVTAYPGGTEGLRASVRRTLTQDTPGVPGVTEPSDYFGEGVAAGDVDGDGYDDVAVGAEYETVGSVPNAGSVVVLRGSADGLTGTAAQAVHQGTKGVPGVNEPYDRFGPDVRLTDTNGDGNADLAVGAPMENTSNGALWSLRGSADGVTSAHAVSFSAATAGLSKDPYQYFGRSMPTSAHGS
ncbi:FG-GAP and VCBS repeat-containing protein [Streptomyces sp. DSM 42041]|uniref:FG-GAP and VCBS repeat-containing protein n=1 Tax=Streptomyces hazeniae TaxID=3075538 RepID=A0ABU2NW39_9ACTN|nr:FG-GAP and VCBS repeat-containing protein [Streptomyces sp. DSM 42041]MDT0380207.1 FG-GAP and VCBS repeat-containing protein [Streptomyces sp. DSM 42041]